MFNLTSLIRKNIRQLQPYSSARHEFQGEASIYLDANESPFNAPYNRYPDPLQMALKEQLAVRKGVRPSQIALGVGSDELIDLVLRIFCEPRHENILAIDPTYGMYQVVAAVNDVEYRKVLLKEDFTLDVDRLLAEVDAQTKVIFLCSPNNPTGNLLDRRSVLRLLHEFSGMVVIDEAYIDFAPEATWLSELPQHPNLIVLQTFSKAWGMAAVRCGMAFASEEVIAYFNKVKYPYNISLLTQEAIADRLTKEREKEAWVRQVIEQRDRLADQLRTLEMVEQVFPSDANFLLVRMANPNEVYQRLVEQGIIVRNRHTVTLCRGTLRITIGTMEENRRLMEALRRIDAR